MLNTAIGKDGSRFTTLTFIIEIGKTSYKEVCYRWSLSIIGLGLYIYAYWVERYEVMPMGRKTFHSKL